MRREERESVCEEREVGERDTVCVCMWRDRRERVNVRGSDRERGSR